MLDIPYIKLIIYAKDNDIKLYEQWWNLCSIFNILSEKSTKTSHQAILRDVPANDVSPAFSFGSHRVCPACAQIKPGGKTYCQNHCQQVNARRTWRRPCIKSLACKYLPRHIARYSKIAMGTPTFIDHVPIETFMSRGLSSLPRLITSGYCKELSRVFRQNLVPAFDFKLKLTEPS